MGSKALKDVKHGKKPQMNVYKKSKGELQIHQCLIFVKLNQTLFPDLLDSRKSLASESGSIIVQLMHWCLIKTEIKGNRLFSEPVASPNHIYKLKEKISLHVQS